MSPASSGKVLRVVLLSFALGAPLTAQTSASVTLDFSGHGTGNPNTLNLSGSGTMSPFGAATVGITSAPSGAGATVSFTFSFGSGGTLTAVSTSAAYATDVLSGDASATGGTGEFMNATGTFSYTITAPPGTTAADVQFKLSGSGSINNLTLQTTTITLPDAMVGVPYSMDVGQGLSQISAGASFALAAGASLPPGLTLSSSGLLSGTPMQSGDYTFGVDFKQGTAPGGALAVSLHVTGSSAAAITVKPDSLSFSLTQGSSTVATQSIVIANSGSSAQNFTASATTNSGGNWLTVSPGTGTIAPFTNGSVSVNVDAGSLKPGTYSGTVSITVSPDNQQSDVAVLVAVNGGQAQLQISQSGLRFRTVAGGGAPLSQSVSILHSGALLPSATSSTTSGETWLSVSPATGAATSGSPSTVTVSVQPQKLKQGDYYGQIKIAADGVTNSPQTVSVVLNVAPAGTDLGAFVDPTGLIFVGQANGSDPASKTISVTNPSPANLTFSASSFFSQGDNWFTVQPATGTVNATNSIQMSVQPSLAKLAAGVYFGEIVLHFAEDNTTRHIAVLLIVVPAAVTRISEAAAAPACTAQKLLPVFTQLGANFTTVAAWPTPIEVTVVDDCGNLMTAGNVTASFSDNDPSLPLTSLNDGRWSATWQPRNASAQVVITVDATELAPPLQGTQNIGGALQANPTTPSINDQGAVSAADNAKNQPLAPGSFISIYGTHLSSGMNPALSLPLATQLGATQVVLGGRQLPLQYAADGQVNAIIPYDVPPNSTQQLIVTNGPELSVPEQVVIASVQPAVFRYLSFGAIVVYKPDGTHFQVDADHPASAGDAVVIYCAGLGPVDPPVAAGSAAPSNPPAVTTNPVTVTIGGKNAKVFFNGLAGGFAGLYQVNAYVPSGIKPGSAVPLVISVAGFDSAPVSIAVK